MASPYNHYQHMFHWGGGGGGVIVASLYDHYQPV